MTPEMKLFSSQGDIFQVIKHFSLSTDQRTSTSGLGSGNLDKNVRFAFFEKRKKENLFTVLKTFI